MDSDSDDVVLLSSSDDDDNDDTLIWPPITKKKKKTKTPIKNIQEQVLVSEALSCHLAQDTLMKETQEKIRHYASSSCQESKAISPTTIALDDSDDNENNIEIRGNEITLRIRINNERTENIGVYSQEPMSKLKMKCCKRWDIQEKDVMIKLDGMEIPMHESTSSLELVENDMLYATIKEQPRKSRKRKTMTLYVEIENAPPVAFSIEEVRLHHYILVVH